MKRLKWLRLSMVAAVAAGVAWGQEDGPGRGVARISVLNGDVSVRRGDSGDWVAAAVNGPLVVEDRVMTGAASRAEVQFDWANLLRLFSDTEVRLSELEYRRYQVQLAQGTVTFRVLRDTDAEAEIATPSVSVRPLKRGIYRLSVQPDGTTQVTVRSGEAEIFTPRGVERLKSGRTMLARGSATDPEFQTTASIPFDEWDRWSEQRDRDLERSRSYQYVSRDIYGADELDLHGTWVYAPPYGWVWSPRVAPGWAPYRQGRWVWIDWYGWSWVSYDPWGWAPYHYGRWFWHTNGWCWYPGPVGSRHYWSPALVAFIGVGGVHVGVGFGQVAWVPLGPHEPLHPWWGNRYYTRNTTVVDNSVHVVNNVKVVNVYRNARVTNGVTAVNAGDFGRGRVTSVVRLSDSDIERASLVQGRVPVAPERESLRMADRDPGRAPERAKSDNERFYSRRTPARVERVSFEEQRRGVEEAARRSFGEPRATTVEGRRAETTQPAAAQPAERSRRSESGESGRGWRRASEPARAESAPATTPAATPAATPTPARPAQSTGEERRGGWRRFGEPAATTPADNGQREAEAAPVRRERSETRSEPRSERPRSERPRIETPRVETPRIEMPRRERREETRVERSREAPRETPRAETPKAEQPRSEGGRAERAAPESRGGEGRRVREK